MATLAEVARAWDGEGTGEKGRVWLGQRDPIPVWTVEEYKEPNTSFNSSSPVIVKKTSTMGVTAPTTPDNNINSNRTSHRTVPESNPAAKQLPSRETHNRNGIPDSLKCCWPCTRRHSAPENWGSSTTGSRHAQTSRLPTKHSDSRSVRESVQKHHKTSSFSCFFIKEDNARFLLLALLLLVYMIIGAGIFQVLEENSEKVAKRNTSYVVDIKINTVKDALVSGNCSWGLIEELLHR